MSFSEKQLSSEASIEIRLKDKSKLDTSTPITSDQALYEISTIKEEINKQILMAVKQSAMDCALYSRSGGKDAIKCFSFGSVSANKFAYQPSIAGEEKDTVADINRTSITWKAKSVTIAGKKYALRQETGEVYDLDSYKLAKESGSDPVLIGKLIRQGKSYKFVNL
jgi:hypothetical protein